MGQKTDLAPFLATCADGAAFTDDGTNAVVKTYPTREDNTGRFYVPFDDTDEEGIVVEGKMPQGYDPNQDLKLEIEGWAADDAVTGGVDMHAALEAITVGSDTIDMEADESFDTENSGVGSVPATAGDPFKITITLTDKDDVQAGDMFRLRVHRKTTSGSDTLSTDFNLHEMLLYQETP